MQVFSRQRMACSLSGLSQSRGLGGVWSAEPTTHPQKSSFPRPRGGKISRLSGFEKALVITPEREKMLYGVLYNKGKGLSLKIHAAGNTEDHIHIDISSPPRLALADCVK
jgi:hypothetical protein